MGSLAEGTTWIKGVSDAEHIADTLRSLRDFGIKVHKTDDGYHVNGGVYLPKNGTIRVGGSGSTLQFLLGLGCRSQGGEIVYVGNHLLRRRPIGPLLEALSQIGVRWEAANMSLPVKLFPGLPRGGTVRIPGTLSQWTSGLLMLAPFAEKETVIEVLPPLNERNYIRLTLGMLRQFGVEVNGSENGHRWILRGGQVYRPCATDIEADLSSAAFLLVLSALHPADVTLTGIRGEGTHPEGQILRILEDMGLPIEHARQQESLRIRHNGITLRGMVIDMQTIPDLLPALCVAAAVAKGRTVLKNIGPGRLKESNRVKAMLQLKKMGVRIRESGDDLIIDGGSPLKGAVLSSYNDHRVQMSLAIAGTVASGKTELTYPNAYKMSYPEFLKHMGLLGVDIHVERTRELEEAVLL
jgi:3-phosphoshikimate 1-carboxyvinyltransferase